MDKATENYIPYGPEWEKEMMKQKKEYLIAMIRRIKEQPKEYTDIEKEAIEIIRVMALNFEVVINLHQEDWEDFSDGGWQSLTKAKEFLKQHLAGYKAASIK